MGMGIVPCSPWLWIFCPFSVVFLTLERIQGLSEPCGAGCMTTWTPCPLPLLCWLGCVYTSCYSPLPLPSCLSVQQGEPWIPSSRLNLPHDACCAAGQRIMDEVWELKDCWLDAFWFPALLRTRNATGKSLWSQTDVAVVPPLSLSFHGSKLSLSPN